jgi:hypothetical protein
MINKAKFLMFQVSIKQSWEIASLHAQLSIPGTGGISMGKLPLHARLQKIQNRMSFLSIFLLRIFRALLYIPN